jgi:NTE family protein
MAGSTALGFSLALGSGGARGLAHIGVLAVLDREGLRPRAIAGTSMGAFIGAMYAGGTLPEQMEEGVESLGLKDIAALTSLTLKPGSLMSADRIEEQLRSLLPATFAELSVPFACVAADLVTGEPAVLSEGDLPRAIRTSMTIPILFDPVRYGDRILVDGGVVDPVPVGLARDLGGGPVVAVDVGQLLPADSRVGSRRGLGPLLLTGDSPNLVQVGTRTLDIMSHRLTRLALGDADVVIAPDVGGYFFADVLEGAEIVQEGVRAAEVALPAVREALAEADRSPLQRWWRRLASG